MDKKISWKILTLIIGPLISVTLVSVGFLVYSENNNANILCTIPQINYK